MSSSSSSSSSSSVGGLGGEKKLKNESVGTTFLTMRVWLVSARAQRQLRIESGERETNALLLRCFLVSTRTVRSLPSTHWIVVPMAWS